MKLTNKLIETLSEKFVRAFVRRMPTSEHLLADLQQEAAIAIALATPKWRANGGASFDTFVRIYAWRAMQECSTKHSGPVSQPMVNGKFEGTKYEMSFEGTKYDADRIGMPSPELELRRKALTEERTPETELERKQADEIVRDFVSVRAERCAGGRKLTDETIKHALHDMISGDTRLETGQRYGVTKQRMVLLAAQAGI